ncbi:cadherin-related tumor suppressor-like isoform X1 [Biomphalaria pfeifferi]|uniref:Cadherin-related tumor suppressor-like isoform X1 n=1 Tax=Biomphalaria pfeifferi TaxID=112525 RepID=A0AAD8C4Z5_BIOPF|nr:cadherin-related tumor suppressor-like isoform X1 [Biomphalaria pfeifferi]
MTRVINFQSIGFFVFTLLSGQVEAQDPCQYTGKTELFLKVLENIQLNEVVYTAPFTENYSIISIQTIFLTPSSIGLFAFNNESRTLYVNDTLDAEKKLPSPRIEIKCTEQAKGRTKSIYVVISIDDVNDNAPVFLKSIYSITVSETTDVGTVITSDVKAVDADLTPAFNIVYYSILDGPYSDYFSLAQMLSTDLTLAKKLDFETIQQMNLTIMAKDSPKEGISFNTTCLLIINIKDEDDQNPVFNATMYRGTVTHNASLGSVVPIEPKMFAYDPDVTFHTNVTYSFHGDEFFYAQWNPFLSGLDLFSQNSSGQSNSILDINPVNAMVTLKSKPEASDVYLLIQATQVDNPSRYGVALLAIQVQGSNVNAPVFTRTAYNVVITEFFPKGEVVTTVVASDADSGSKILYSLDDATLHFSINNLTGDVLLMKELNYLNKSQYIMRVSASDGTLQTNASLTVSIWPGNRYPPQILTTSQHVQGQRVKGFFIIKVQANDSDIGTRLLYTLMTYADLFSIDQQGQIKITSEPYLLVYNSYPLTVVVSDNGQPNYQSSVVITVNFPINASSLTFSRPSYSVVITETFPKDQVITTVQAINSFNTSSLVYNMEDTSGHFSINSLTGDVMLIKEISYISKSQYVFNITAKDDLTKTYVPLTVNVWPVNRYPPQILSTARQVEALRDKGQIIIKILANDSDAIGTNLTFKLLTFNDLFTISQQGDIMTIANSDRYTNNSYAITVVVSDSGVPSYDTAAVITVNFPPLPAALVAAAEMSPVAAIVLGVLAGVFLIIIIILALFIFRRRLSDKKNLDKAKKPTSANETRALAYRQKQGTLGRQAKVNMGFIEDITELDVNVQENPLNGSSKGAYYNFIQGDQDSVSSDIQKSSDTGIYHNTALSDQDSGSGDIQVETTVRPEGSDQDFVIINGNLDEQSVASTDSDEHSPTVKHSVPQLYRNESLSTNHDSSDSDISYSPSPVDTNGMKRLLMPGSLARTKVPEESLSYQDDNSISLNNSSSMENVNSDDLSYSPGYQKQELTVYF